MNHTVILKDNWTVPIIGVCANEGDSPAGIGETQRNSTQQPQLQSDVLEVELYCSHPVTFHEIPVMKIKSSVVVISKLC